MTKTELSEPVLGLGEDYEPFDLSDDDVVWFPDDAHAGYWPLVARLRLAFRGATPVFVCEADVLANDCAALGVPLCDAKAWAREAGRTRLALVDARLNVLKEWPLTEGK